MSGENTERQQKINELFINTVNEDFLGYMKELKFKPSDDQLMMIVRNLWFNFSDEAKEQRFAPISKDEISLAITNFVFNHIDEPNIRVKLQEIIYSADNLIKKSDSSDSNEDITVFIGEFHKAFQLLTPSKEENKDNEESASLEAEVGEFKDNDMLFSSEKEIQQKKLVEERQNDINEFFVIAGETFLDEMRKTDFNLSDNQLEKAIETLKTNFLNETKEAGLKTVTKNNVLSAVEYFVSQHINDEELVKLDKMISSVSSSMKNNDYIANFKTALSSQEVIQEVKQDAKKKLAEKRQQKINELFVNSGNKFLNEMRKVDFKPSSNQFETGIQNLVKNSFESEEAQKAALGTIAADDFLPAVIDFISHLEPEELVKLGVMMHAGYVVSEDGTDYYRTAFQTAFSSDAVSQDNKENIEKELLKNVKEFFSPSAIEAYCYFCMDNNIIPSDVFGQNLVDIFQDKSNPNKLKSVGDVYIKLGKEKSVDLYNQWDDITSMMEGGAGIAKVLLKFEDFSKNVLSYLKSGKEEGSVGADEVFGVFEKLGNSKKANASPKIIKEYYQVLLALMDWAMGTGRDNNIDEKYFTMDRINSFIELSQYFGALIKFAPNLSVENNIKIESEALNAHKNKNNMAEPVAYDVVSRYFMAVVPEIITERLNGLFKNDKDPFSIIKSVNYKKVRNISTENIVNYLSSLAAADQKKMRATSLFKIRHGTKMAHNRNFREQICKSEAILKKIINDPDLSKIAIKEKLFESSHLSKEMYANIKDYAKDNNKAVWDYMEARDEKRANLVSLMRDGTFLEKPVSNENFETDIEEAKELVEKLDESQQQAEAGRNLLIYHLTKLTDKELRNHFVKQLLGENAFISQGKIVEIDSRKLLLINVAGVDITEFFLKINSALESTEGLSAKKLESIYNSVFKDEAKPAVGSPLEKLKTLPTSPGKNKELEIKDDVAINSRASMRNDH